MWVLPLREAEHGSHEGERRDGVPLLALPLRVPERIEVARDHEVLRVHAVYRTGYGVDHAAIRAPADRAEIEAHVGLVPDLEHVTGRRTLREAVEVSGERRRELSERGDLGRPSIDTLGALCIGPVRRGLEIEDRRQA